MLGWLVEKENRCAVEQRQSRKVERGRSFVLRFAFSVRLGFRVFATHMELWSHGSMAYTKSYLKSAYKDDKCV